MKASDRFNSFTSSGASEYSIIPQEVFDECCKTDPCENVCCMCDYGVEPILPGCCELSGLAHPAHKLIQSASFSFKVVDRSFTVRPSDSHPHDKSSVVGNREKPMCDFGEVN